VELAALPVTGKVMRAALDRAICGDDAGQPIDDRRVSCSPSRRVECVQRASR
jgi:hypothetical protein